MSGPADLLLANASVLTLDPRQPRGEAVAVRGGRVLAVGALADLRPLVGPSTEVVDAEGGLAVPAFHDAHLHLLSYARAASRVDCRHLHSIAALGAALAERARGVPPGTWIRASGYDETHLREARHPDRHDLDAAVPQHPVRLQHRSLHLDVLNTSALRRLNLMTAAAVERDPATDEPTGRLYHAAELLHARLDRPPEDDLAADVRRASERLLAWGVTSVQDASITNGAAEWALFYRLAARNALQVRLFLLPGARHWRDLAAPRPHISRRGWRAAAPLTFPDGASRYDERGGQTTRVYLGPVKIMLDEATTDPAEVRATVAEVRAAGWEVALHAISEAEVAIALDALRRNRRRRQGPWWQMAAPPVARPLFPPRIEHGAVIPDALLDEIRMARVMVVGQPTLVYERGDVYRAEYPPELHPWLHRAASLVRRGIPYAAGSDAPVAEPAPGLGLFAAQRRRTRRGATLEPQETLGPEEALAAFTLGPARAVAATDVLGVLRPGALADVAVLDPEVLLGASVEAGLRPARLTIMEGRVVWRRPS